jgi:hypothetical protein
MRYPANNLAAIVQRGRTLFFHPDFPAAVECIVFATLSTPITLCWARKHSEFASWFGMAITSALSIFIWGYLIKQVYTRIQFMLPSGEKQ